MAEGFARAYGADVMIPSSAGLSPASIVQTLTHLVMEEKNIWLDGHYPKSLEMLSNVTFDLIVNLSGRKLPPVITTPVVEWKVEDPIGRNETVYRAVRDEIERRVVRLVLELRTPRPEPKTLPVALPEAPPFVSRRQKVLEDAMRRSQDRKKV